VPRAGISATKVDFDIPPQPHGRHLKQLIAIVDASGAPETVKARARDAFTMIASMEAQVHGISVDRVHLHEVGAVDAILDVVGSLWGIEMLGVTSTRCGAISLGDGFIDAQHGRLPVPAPATLALLEGFTVRAGPPDSGELTTPTGASLARVLSSGPPPATYVPRRVGYGAGTKDFSGRPNVLRIVLCDDSSAVDHRENLAMLAADIDDATAEQLAVAAERLRARGALDVTTSPVTMKKGRVGTRIEVLCAPGNADELEVLLLSATTTLGVRRADVSRRTLNRDVIFVDVQGHRVAVKRSYLPGGDIRLKPESDDVAAVSTATGKPFPDIVELAVAAARRHPSRV
jgi:uncharacterized protein (TIGR00299 family) protein